MAKTDTLIQLEFNQAPRAGFEPATLRLTGEYSTAELPRNINLPGYYIKELLFEID